MTRMNFLKAAFGLFAVIFMVALTSSTSQAQPNPPCPDYWVNYNYVYPPDPVGGIPVQVNWINGFTSNTAEFSDGHYTYPSVPSPGAPIRDIFVAGVLIPPPYPTSSPFLITTPYGILRVEIRYDSKGCLEIRLSY